jgi:serine/threonine protein phosphatase 1
MKKTYVIGDIHGALKALKQVIDRCNPTMGSRLIFLGDYVDGWSESSEVIQYLLELDAIYDCIFLRGNHDEWCSEWLNTGVAKDLWLNQGGKSTFDSYLKTKYNQDHSHIAFFRKLHNYFIDENNRGYVHGGFKSRKGLGHESYQSDYYWDRDLWGLALLNHGRIHFDSDMLPVHERFNKHKEIFIGHTTTLQWECKPHYPEYKDPKMETLNGPITIPMKRCNVWNLDTGGGYKGKITMMDVDTKEFLQSDVVNELYTNENGR